MVFAHTAGASEFSWAVVAELSLVVWTTLLLVAPRFGGTRRPWRFRIAGLSAALLAALITLAGKTLEVRS